VDIGQVGGLAATTSHPPPLPRVQKLNVRTNVYSIVLVKSYVT